MRRFIIVSGAAIALGGGVASADLHTWNINEIYSNASGTIQFIELDEVAASNNQHRLSTSFAFPNHTVKSTAQNPDPTYTFTSDLPSNITASKKFLLGTAGYAALPGAVAPDYVIPDDFFLRSGDTITFSTVDSFTFTGAQYPSSNPLFSLGDDLSTGVATPTNFAGLTGSVPEPTVFAIGGVLAAAFLGRRPGRRRPC